MSGSENWLLTLDSHPGGSALIAVDQRMSNEAFEQARKDAISSTQNGGTGLSPDSFLKITRPADPWNPPNPVELHPQTPDLPTLPGKPGGPIVVQPPDDGGLLHTNPGLETTASKVGREVLVIGGGVGESFFYNIADLPKHIPQIASSVVIGGTLAAITKTGKLGAGVALVVGAYFTTRFLLDSFNDHKRWDKFGDAVKDTWKSGDNLTKNINKVSDTLGNYTFDTTLSLASSYIGYQNPQLAALLTDVLRIPPVVPNATPPFSPALSVAGFYLDVMPPTGFYQKYQDRTPLAPGSFEVDLHGTLRRVPGTVTRTPDLLLDVDEDRDRK